jgi:hypothetical protein
MPTAPRNGRSLLRHGVGSRHARHFLDQTAKPLPRRNTLEGRGRASFGIGFQKLGNVRIVVGYEGSHEEYSSRQSRDLRGLFSDLRVWHQVRQVSQCWAKARGAAGAGAAAH